MTDLERVQKDWRELEHIENQTEEMCITAVRQDGLALKFVKEQTPEICLEAVKRNGHALYYVKEQTPEICLAAVKRHGNALKYVKEQTPEICLEAVIHDDDATRFVWDHLIAEVRQALSLVDYQKLFTEVANKRGFISSADIEAFRDELADSYFGGFNPSDPWERAYRAIEGE